MHRRTAGQDTPPRTASGFVAASAGSAMFTTDHGLASGRAFRI
jgi:hypothetical protein